MTSYRFRCLGPFNFSTYKDKKGNRTFKHLEARNQVFDEAEKVAGRLGISNIRRAVGLYVFGLSPSGSAATWPYYVGKAGIQPLYTQLFQQQDKPQKYSSILSEYQRAKPFVYIFPLMTEAGNQVKPAKKGASIAKIIDNAEKILIAHALSVNPALYNVQHVISMSKFIIDGTPQASRSETNSARMFRKMMGFEVADARIKQFNDASIHAFETEDARAQEIEETPIDELEPEFEITED